MIKRNFAIRLHGSPTWYITGVTTLVAGIIATKIDVPKAEPKTNYFDIPGRDGELDRSEAFGAVFYKSRTITLSCSVMRGCTFDMDSFAALFAGQKVDIIDCVTGGSIPASAYYYTGRLSIQNDDALDKLRSFELSLKAEPYSYKLSASQKTIEPTMASMEYIRLFNITPETSDLGNVAGYAYNDYRTVIYGPNGEGQSAIWKYAVTAGHSYSLSIDSYGLVVEIKDSDGDAYNPDSFTATEGYIYIHVTRLRPYSAYIEISIAESQNVETVTVNRFTELLFCNPNPANVVLAVINGRVVLLRQTTGNEPTEADPQLYLSPGANTIAVLSSQAQNSAVKLAWVEGRL